MKPKQGPKTDMAHGTPSGPEANDCVTVGRPRWEIRRPSKEVRDDSMPGELVVHGYSEDAKIPSTVARRLQLVDAIWPLPGKPGIWIVPVERMAFGLVREASAKGMTARAELESYVAEGLAECGDSVDTVVVRHLVDRCLAARLASRGSSRRSSG